jgi:membrane protein YqaA with SNARE-associated domain
METEKWQLSYQRWHERIVGRPILAGGISFASAVTGFPPLAVIAVLAGTLRMNFPIFIVTVVIGRTIRFWLVLAGVGMLFGH